MNRGSFDNILVDNYSALSFKQCFSLDNETNQTKCVIEDGKGKLCGQIYKSYYPSTLWMHLKKKHGPIHNILITNRKKRERLNYRSAKPGRLLSLCQTRTDLVELVTVYKRPFKIVDDAPMQRILKRAAADEKSDRNAPIFTMYKLIKDVESAAGQIKLMIQKEIKERYINIMVDIVSKYGRSVLGVCAQFIKNDQIVLRTLNMQRLNESHTGDYIAELLQETLDEYEISSSKIYSFTTDSGKNLLKAVKTLNKKLEDSHLGIERATDFQQADIDEDFSEFAELLDTDDEEETQAQNGLFVNEENNINVDGGDHENILSEVYLNANRNTIPMENILCGAHSIQLCIQHGIKKWDLETNLLTICRTIVCKLRTQNVRYELQHRNPKLPAPIIDCDTRWNSCYLMVSTNFFSTYKCTSHTDLDLLFKLLFVISSNEKHFLYGLYYQLNKIRIFMPYKYLSITFPVEKVFGT